jgi:hypothetical protein
MAHKNRKKFRTFMFQSAECSLLRAAKGFPLTWRPRGWK